MCGPYCPLASPPVPRMQMDPIVIALIGVVIVVGSILAFRLHAFLALILAAMVVAGLTGQEARESYAKNQVDSGKWTEKVAGEFSSSTLAKRVATGFGETAGKIGVLVALASIVGICMLESGAADRIVRSTLYWCGEARASLAFLSSGFVLGIPVFFDTVFYLMVPLAKALRFRTGRDYTLYVLSIVAGATMTHSLVPPTPGPLYVAEKLKVDIGWMILGGCLVGVITSSAGYLYAMWINRRLDVPLRSSPELSEEVLQSTSQRDLRQLPPLWLSLTPIVLPVVLIAGKTVFDALWGKAPSTDRAPWQNTLLGVSNAVGDANLALAIATVVALFMTVWQLRMSRTAMSTMVQNSLLSAGEVILITGAGGAFGMTLEQSGIAARLAEFESLQQLPIVVVAFVLAMLVRTAQGSATVAMITSVGIVGPLVAANTSVCSPLYVALAIGCGSKPLAWMNDSGFWVISKMSGLNEREMLRTVTPMSAVMGFSGLAAVLLLSWLLPNWGM